MKHKYIPMRLLACLTAACLAAGALTSCAVIRDILPEKERAVQVYEQAVRNAGRADSLTGETEVHMSGKKDRTPFDIRVSSTYTAARKPEFSELTKTVSKVSVGGGIHTETMQEGYADGKAFVSVNGSVQTYSEMTEKEYAEWRAERAAGDLNVMQMLTDVRAAGSRTCEKDAVSGGYIVTVKDAGEKNLAAFDALTEELGALVDELETEQVIFTFETDKNLYFTHIEVEFIFADSECKPVLTVIADFSDWNKTEAEDYEIGRSFVELPDIRLASRAADAYAKLTDRESGHFRAAYETLFDYAGQRQELKETDRVEFFTADDRFYFTIDSDYDGTAWSTAYADGELVNMGPDNYRHTQTVTDAQARQYLKSLANLADFTLYTVTGMEKGEDDRHFTLELAVPDEFFGLSGDLTVRTKSAAMDVTLREDGSVEKTVLRAECSCSGQYGNGYMTETVTTEFPAA